LSCKKNGCDDEVLVDAKADEMASRVAKRMRKKYSEDLGNFQKWRSDKNKNVGECAIDKGELKRLKGSIKKVDAEIDNSTHINMIKRLTSDGDELVNDKNGPVVDSPEVMELLLAEHELDDYDDN